MLITDHEFVQSRMNGLPYNAGKFAFSLRKRLMMEHLGLLEDAFPRTKAKEQIDVNDPICPTFYNDIWCKIAEKNTRIYEEIFRCYPTNLVRIFNIHLKIKTYIFCRLKLSKNFLPGVQRRKLQKMNRKKHGKNWQIWSALWSNSPFISCARRIFRQHLPPKKD